MPTKLEITTSKFLCYILRHRPDAIGLALTPDGWADIDELIEKSAQGRKLSRALIDQVVAGDEKSRFALSADGRAIRTSQGHSAGLVNLLLEPMTPPHLLYHGTATQFLPAIRQDGLRPQRREHVHLAMDENTALKVGGRHGSAVVLRVDSLAMHTAGYRFYRSENGVWLTASVPPTFLSIG